MEILARFLSNMQTFTLCISISHIIQHGVWVELLTQRATSVLLQLTPTKEGFLFSLSVLGQMNLYEYEPVNFMFSSRVF